MDQTHDKYRTKLTVNDKSVNGVFGLWTQGGRMVGTNESTELWRHPKNRNIYQYNLGYFVVKVSDWAELMTS